VVQAQEIATSMEAAAKHTSKQQGGASSKEHELYNLPPAEDLWRKGHVSDKYYFW